MSSGGSHSVESAHVPVRTAVIPAAGQGTRMLPATKSVPKELLPLGERPALQYIVDEALGAGVEHLVVISSPAKPAIADYFAPSTDVEQILRRLGREDLAAEQQRNSGELEISIVLQHEALGLGHAVGLAREAVGGESFYVMLPDELMEDSALLREMAAVHARVGSSVVAVKRMPREQISRYGVVAPLAEMSDEAGHAARVGADVAARMIRFDDVVEKPDPQQAPSDLAIIGRYLLTPDIFDDLERIEPGAGGELQLTDALARQARRAASTALVSSIGRRDIGQPLGWVKAVIERAVADPRIGTEIRRWIAEESFDSRAID